MQNKNSYRVVYALSEGEGRTRWTKVGVAFGNRDGSVNVALDAIPVSGRLQIRDASERDGSEWSRTNPTELSKTG